MHAALLRRLAVRCLAAVAALAAALVPDRSASAQVGGGYTQAGPVGEYFANNNLTGSPSFTRREVRLDFDWGTVLPVGGSIAEPYRSFPTDNFSVRYTGQVIAAFTETYTFKAIADDGVRVFIKPAGAGSWTTLIDQWSTSGTWTATYAMTSGSRYDVRVEYRELTGSARLALRWSSASVPEETVDVVTSLGFNHDGSWGQTFADIVKCARNGWEGIDGNPAPSMDAQGWPQGNGAYVFQESLNQGLGLDPLMRGKVTFRFNGRADVSLFGNVVGSSLTTSYDAGTNTTTGSFTTQDLNINASSLSFRNTDRDGQVPARNNGITNFKMMRPSAPDSTTSYAFDALFLTQIRAAVGDTFTSIRVQLNNANQERFWSDRTSPNYFNQARGLSRPSVYPPNYGLTYANGPSWEHKILLCNETGRDLFVNLPIMASGWTPSDTTSYAYQLARLIRYGSDANGNPYTTFTANPVHPPLNPNLRVYVEISNEVWNFFSDAFRQFGDLGGMIASDADAALGVGSSDPLARPTDFAIYNYDNLSTAKDGNGNYASTGTWRFRKHLLRAIQVSDIFRAVWGDANMHTRVRPLYEWQYADDNGTASGPLKFADDWFNNGNGATNVATPYPVSRFIWGGGGASYYGATNGYGVTTQLVNSGFDNVSTGNGYTAAPSGHSWSFSGTAGIARDAGGSDDIPPPFNGAQSGYIDGAGAMTINVTVPSSQTSNLYSVVFKAVQRVKTNAPLDGNGNPIPDAQKVRLLINGQPSNSRSFNQDGTGFTPTAWNSAYPWESSVVFWTRGTAYYSSNTFTAAPGSTVTVRIEGTAAAGNIAFIEDVRLASIDQMFADGFPGGGEALGQPAGTGYQNGLNTQGSWALAYGLKYVTYEGGWSLGGDTGGSPMQNRAKYGDSRAAAVNVTALGMFHKAGGFLNTLGTYAQWPSWSDSYAQEGLLDLTTNPLSQGQLTTLNNLPPTPTNGVTAPAVLTFANRALAQNNSAATLNAGGWMSWNVVVPRTGTYTIGATTTAGGNLRLLANDATVVASGASGSTLSGNVTLTAGIHGLKVRRTSGSFTITQVTIAAAGAPSAPTIGSITDGNLTLTVNWGTVSGATGYRLRWGTTSGNYTNSVDTGSGTSTTLTGLTHNTTYYLAAGAYNASGESLPSVERVAVALADGQSGTLAGWDLLAAGSIDGSAATAPATASSARVTPGALTRGAGLPGEAAYQSNAGGTFNAHPGIAPADLAAAKSANAYFQWTIAPVSGYRLSVGTLRVVPYKQGSSGTLAVEASSNGFATAGTLVGTSAITGDWQGSVVSFTTSGIGLLQDVTGTITFRAYFYNHGGYVDRGFGQLAGNNNDIEIVGTLVSTGAPPPAPTGLSATPGNGQVSLSWNASSGATGYNVKRSTTSGGPYTTVATGVTSTSTVNTGLTNGTTYYYVVSATNGSGESGNSAQASATPQVTAPAAPTGFSATAGDGQVSLSWNASAGATSYTLKRSTTSGGPYTNVATALTSTSTVNTGLTNGTTYHYVVSASNAGGQSPNSAQASATPTAGPAAGVLAAWDLLAAGSTSGGATTVAATSTAANVTTGALSRGSGFPSSPMYPTYTWGSFNANPPPFPADLAAAKTAGHWFQWAVGPASGYRVSLSQLRIYGYRQGVSGSMTIEASTDGFATAGATVGTFVLSATEWNGQLGTFSLGSLSSLQNTTSTVTFRAYIWGIDSGYRDRGIGQLSGNNADIEVSGTVTSAGSPPAAPTGLSATPGDQQVALTWGASAGATSYTVKRSSVSGGPYSVIASGLTGTSTTNTGLMNGSVYYYVVSASNASGESPNSAQVSATPTGPTPPAAPTGLSAVAGNAQVSLSWNASSGATSYIVRYGTTSGSWPSTQTGIAGTSATVTGLTNGTTYYFVVAGVNSGGTGANSSQASATPTAPTTTTGITRQWWTGISGTGIANLTGNAAYPLSPTGTDTLPSMRATNWANPSVTLNWAENYGQRLRGFITAPATGAYTFWVSGDDQCELWLSTDDTPANRVRIAWVNSWTSQDQWGKETNQRSSNNSFTFAGGAAGVVNLTAGRRYFVEVLHKEGGGGDSLSVGWRKPADGAGTTPAEIVPGSVLTPWVQPVGTVLREYWTGIGGVAIADLTGAAAYPLAPSGRTTLSSLRATDWANASVTLDWADNYGQRVRGFLVAPATGAYTFWVASDDASELWLSTDDNPANRVRVAWVNGWSNQDEWTRETNQRSTANAFTFAGGAAGVINLTSGRRYFLEVLQKEGVGGDNLSVGWRKPADGAGSTPAEIVPGSVVAPYGP